MQEANEKFNNQKVIPTFQLEKKFTVISGLICLDPNAIMTKINPTTRIKFPDNYKTYLFPNDIGVFGFNTYLYAFFSEIVLIGIPNNLAEYDNVIGCPLSFMSHDYGHANSFLLHKMIKKSDMTNMRNIYYNILNSDYSTKFKELLILVLWYLIHEIGKNDFMSVNFGDYYNSVDIGVSFSNPFID